MLASEAGFLKAQIKIRAEVKNCLIFLHGLNKNFEDVLEAAAKLIIWTILLFYLPILTISFIANESMNRALQQIIYHYQRKQ